MPSEPKQPSIVRVRRALVNNGYHLQTNYNGRVAAQGYDVFATVGWRSVYNAEKLRDIVAWMRREGMDV